MAGNGVDAALIANGGAEPYRFTVTQGVLPDGLALNLDGTFSGIVNEAGAFSFTVTATDADNFTGEREYTLAVAAPVIALDPGSLDDGMAYVDYAASITAAGGSAPYQFHHKPLGGCPVG